jgi:predicted dehydrogenase
MTRVAIVGGGRMGQAHAAAWADLAPEVEVAAVVDRTPRPPLAAVPRARPTTELDEVLRDATIEILSICTPTDTHLDLARRALGAGKHVLLEKPLARTVTDGEALVRLAAEAPGILMVAHVVRFFPGYIAVRELAEGGSLGTLREVHASRISPTGGRPPWLEDEERSGGVLLDLAVHDLDQLLLFLGPARRVEVSRLDDGALEARVEHTSGAVGSVRAGWDAPLSTPFRTSLEAVGDRGRARYSFASGTEDRSELEVAVDGSEHTVAVDPDSPYTAQARAFLDCIRTGSAPRDGDPSASLAAVRLALAARESLRGGGAVEVG